MGSKEHGGVQDGAQATVPLGCKVRSCETNQPPLEEPWRSSQESWSQGCHSLVAPTRPDLLISLRFSLVNAKNYEFVNLSSKAARLGKERLGGEDSQNLSWSRWCWRSDPDVFRYHVPTAVPWSHGDPEQDLDFSKWITKPGKSHLLCHKMNILWKRGKKKKKKKERMRWVWRYQA